MYISSGRGDKEIDLKPGDNATVASNKWFLDYCTSIDHTKYGSDYIFLTGTNTLRVNTDFIDIVRDLDNVVVSSVIDSCGEKLYTISCPDNQGLMKPMFLMTYLTRDMLAKASDKVQK
jgi:hypothetical protein